MHHNAKLTTTSRWLHWSVAIGILILLGTGFYMANFEIWSLYDWHKTLGVLLLLLLAARAIYRLRRGWPTPAGRYSRLEQTAARWVHWALLLGVFLLPITGLMYSGAGGFGVPVFGWELIPSNYVEGEPVAYNAALSNFGDKAHEILGWLLAAVIALHVLGALKHHLFDKDDTLRRMLGRARGRQ